MFKLLILEASSYSHDISVWICPFPQLQFPPSCAQETGIPSKFGLQGFDGHYFISIWDKVSPSLPPNFEVDSRGYLFSLYNGLSFRAAPSTPRATIQLSLHVTWHK